MDINFTVPDVFKYEFGLTKTKVDLAWHPTLQDAGIRNLVDLTTPPYTNTPNFIVVGNLNVDRDYFPFDSHFGGLRNEFALHCS